MSGPPGLCGDHRLHGEQLRQEGLSASARQKQYGADHLAILLFIALAKQVLPMENVAKLLSLSPEEVSIQEAYTQLRERMHDALQVTFGYKAPTVRTAGMDDPSGILESLVIAVSHVIYLNHCFDLLSTGEKK